LIGTPHRVYADPFSHPFAFRPSVAFPPAHSAHCHLQWPGPALRLRAPQRSCEWILPAGLFRNTRLYPPCASTPPPRAQAPRGVLGTVAWHVLPIFPYFFSRSRNHRGRLLGLWHVTHKRGACARGGDCHSSETVHFVRCSTQKCHATTSLQISILFTPSNGEHSI